jgi:hypothetical protein
MAKTFTLDNFREAAEKKYGAMEIDLGDGTVCRLTNALRLPKSKRDSLLKMQDDMKKEGADQEQMLMDCLRLVAESVPAANKLLKAIGSDLAVLAEIFEQYSEGTQAGEASASRD